MPDSDLVRRLTRYHRPNQDQTQCEGCLRAWPCEPKQLLDIIKELTKDA